MNSIVDVKDDFVIVVACSIVVNKTPFFHQTKNSKHWKLVKVLTPIEWIWEEAKHPECIHKIC